jgi:hypothetical protein
MQRSVGGRGMTVRAAFVLSPQQWEIIESKYEAIANQNAEEMVVALLSGATFEQKQYLALGIMIGRASMRSEPG